MRLLYYDSNGELNLTEDLVNEDQLPPYAILSHTWEEGQEATFRDLKDGTGRNKTGYDKIRFCGQQAKSDGLRYFWIDTCCIDKSSNVELQEAINSMFRLYQNAAKCYVHLADVSTVKRRASNECSEHTWEAAFRESRWFTRGWTLQELLAPKLVEFFSEDGKKLGDKKGLDQQIRDITGVAILALQGVPLHKFGINERLSWAETRQTTRKEDKAYSLLGMFSIYMPLIYGEGESNAFNRLREQIDKPVAKDQECIQYLRITDPKDDKKRIEDSKGGLLEGSYRWILENSDYNQWRSDWQSHLLWIKGDPGKSKTMLLCGIINELEKSITNTDLLSYFFCQATDSRINNATAVLRGLIYSLVDQRASLVQHVRKKYDHAGKTLFDDTNAWFALAEIFTNILHDLSLSRTYIIIDALDECVTDLPKLQDIIQKTSASPHIKWIVSSRNLPNIEKNFNKAMQKLRLCLELNEESVSEAVNTYIEFKVDCLAKQNRYEDNTRDTVKRYLSLNANGTFLWVALVCQELDNTPGWKAQRKLTALPPGLNPLYEQMMNQICVSEDAGLCKRVLAVVSAVFRPITIDELTSFVDMPDGVSGNDEALSEIVGLCGSFLTLRGNTISFVHQSAIDFLFEKASQEIFPTGTKDIHYLIFSRSLLVMSKTLRRDIYELHALGYSMSNLNDRTQIR